MTVTETSRTVDVEIRYISTRNPVKHTGNYKFEFSFSSFAKRSGQNIVVNEWTSGIHIKTGNGIWGQILAPSADSNSEGFGYSSSQIFSIIRLKIEKKNVTFVSVKSTN